MLAAEKLLEHRSHLILVDAIVLVLVERVPDFSDRVDLVESRKKETIEEQKNETIEEKNTNRELLRDSGKNNNLLLR